MCPCCEQETFHQNGAFWTCATCGLAITEQALAYERMQATRDQGEGTKDVSNSPQR